MRPPTPPRLCIVPRISGISGMASFQARLIASLARRGVEVTRDPADTPYVAILVIGGTRQLGQLWRRHRQGVPVVQRLDGMNWVHRVRHTGLRHYLRAEYGNFILNTIRTRLADRLVYQSRFAQRWWECAYGPISQPSAVITNGVDLGEFSPAGPHQRPGDRLRLLLVEGNLFGGYEVGLENAVSLVEALARRVSQPVELMVAGKVVPAQQDRIDRSSKIPIRWAGVVPREHIPEIDRSAHLLFSADINAACPNTVIEALACGLPVVSFDTGALPEMVPPEAGRVVPYGGDPWRLEQPDFEALAEAAAEALQDQARLRAGARAHAEAAFGLDRMVAAYSEVLF